MRGHAPRERGRTHPVTSSSTASSLMRGVHLALTKVMYSATCCIVYGAAAVAARRALGK